MSSSTMILLPGDIVPESEIPATQSQSQAQSKPSKRKLVLGPGLKYVPPTSIVATLPGTLNSIRGKKNVLWLDSRGGRYTPSFDDPVIVRVTGTANESFVCQLSPYTSPALLPHLSFENVAKKTKPNLPIGALIYARVATPAAHLLPCQQTTEAELTCINPNTTKADGLGPLKGGMVFEISLQMARRMLLTGKRAKTDGQVVLLEALGRKWRFEIAVGRNGYVWVDCPDGEVERIIAIGNAIVRCDEMSLTIPEQEKLAAELLRKY